MGTKRRESGRSAATHHGGLWYLIVLVWCAGALVACGSTTPTDGGGGALPAGASTPATPTVAATPAALDPCQVVPLSDAQVFAKTTLDAGMEGNPTNPSCTYNSPPTGPTAQVEIHLGDGAKKIYDIDIQLAHSFTSPPGIGDEAHEENNAIFFRKGTLWVSITCVLLDVDGPTVQASLPKLAQAATARIPS